MLLNVFLKAKVVTQNLEKKGINEQFSLTNDQFKLKLRKDKPHIHIPNFGLVRMREALRFQGKLLSAKIFTKAGKWFVSIAVELDEPPKLPNPTGKAVGVDLGITTLATLSDGTKIDAPKPLKQKFKQLRRANKALSRKQKGSKNREKAKTKLSRLHYKIACIRQDFLHKTTSNLVQDYDVIAIEHLNVQGMMKNRKLARAISDLGFYEFKRQLIYKAKQTGKLIKSVGRFFSSLKMCSCCDAVMAELPLSVRNWTCQVCQSTHDRDINASINILNHADIILT